MTTKSNLHISGVYKSSFLLLFENIVPLFLLAVVLFTGLLFLMGVIEQITKLEIYSSVKIFRTFFSGVIPVIIHAAE